MKILANGNSMFPTLKDGHYYKLNKSKKPFNIGEIIVYRIEDIYICHRVIKIIKTQTGRIYYKTQGDNCEFPDPYAVTDKMILGRIVV